MNAIIYILVVSIASGYIAHDFRTKQYVPKTPRLPVNALEMSSPKISETFNSNISPFIAGGNEVSPPHKYPFLVFLYIGTVYFCGGVLISDEWVLTAGHCTSGGFGSIIVQMGSHNISGSEASDVEDESLEFITHENYSGLTFNNDIGLVKLPAPVTFTNEIQTIALPSANDQDLGEGVSVTLTGWGDVTGGHYDVPYEVTVPTIINANCADNYGASITNGSLCTSGAGGRGACDSDGGGPVIYETGSGYQLRGIISFEGACGNSFPTAHTRVTHYLDWIQANTGIVL